MTTKNFKVKNGIDIGDNISITETGAVTGISTSSITEGTNLYYTNARADARVAAGIANLVDSAPQTLDTLNELAAALGDDPNFATTVSTAMGNKLNTADFTTTANTWLGTKSTTNLTEGTNLYYTSGRANTNFDTRLATKNTDNLNEGSTNQYFTTARARQSISATDTGGDGSLSYDNSTGVITYTGPTATEVRAHFSGGTGVTITDGSIAIGQAVDTTSDVQFDDITGGSLTVDNININGNTIISTDTNGNITLTPNGNGDVVTSKNYVRGAIRNATTDTNGFIWYLNTSSLTAPYTGVSVDNSPSTTTQSAIVLRNYTGNNTAASIGNRARVIFEKARNTVASPAAIATGDLLGEVAATGYTSTGWINDQFTFVPAFFGFNATENWVSNTNLGSTFNMALSPTATTIASNADLVNCITFNPQIGTLRSDTMAIMQGKTVGFIATGCSISGTTLTIGTVTTGTVAIGQMIQNAAGIINTACYIVSGSGSTWTLNFAPGNQTAQTITGRAGFISSVAGSTSIINNLRLGTNIIANSANQTQVTLTSDRSNLTLVGDTITMDTVSGTDMLVLNPGNTKLSSNNITLEDSAGADYLVLNSISATFTKPVGFPVYTSATKPATGSIGQQICISDSAGGGNPNGMMAFWDTSNNRWSYIHDNSAV